MHTNKRELKKQQQEKQTTECTKERSVTEPQPKTKTHHGGTETRRRSKPIFTREDTKEHEEEGEGEKHDIFLAWQHQHAFSIQEMESTWASQVGSYHAM